MSPIERSAGGGGSSGGGSMATVFHSQLVADAANIDTGANAIPATARELVVYARMRTDEALILTTSVLTLNADTGAHYDRFAIAWNGVAVAAVSAYAQTNLAMDCVGNNSDANRFTSLQVTWIDYADTASFKTGISVQEEFGTATNANVRVHPGDAWAWRSTAAINQVTIAPNAGAAKFKAGSSLTIYTLT